LILITPVYAPSLKNLIRYLRLDAETCSKEHEIRVTDSLLATILVSHEKMAGILRVNIGMGGGQ